jgi:nitrogen-specific signal transduction histidine kinase
MASPLAHEIHNPLDTVGNLLFLIGANPDAPEAVRQQAAMAGEEVTRVTQMTRHMPSFQRESSKPVPVKIGDILDNVIAATLTAIRLPDFHGRNGRNFVR